MAKTFSHIGVATYKGKTKFRFTQGRADARIKTMTKEGFTNIEFLALPAQMTKEQALLTPLAQELATRHGLDLGVAVSDATTPDAEVAA